MFKKKTVFKWLINIQKGDASICYYVLSSEQPHSFIQHVDQVPYLTVLGRGLEFSKRYDGETVIILRGQEV